MDVFGEVREREFARLDETGQTYLDFTGSGLAPRRLIDGHHERNLHGVFGNPHSESPSSQASTDLVEHARAAVLRFFHADPGEYAVVFTPNATGACRLVGEAYPFRRGTRLVMLMDDHNSVNGIREFARARGVRVRYIPLRAGDLRADGATVRAGLPRRRSPGLFVYPAQSNFTGVQHPLEWVTLAQRRGYDVLLDAAAFVPASPLDLSAVKPDFVPVSWYKVFGYPTGVGCLVARRAALARLRRPWFAGGTIQASSALGGWHVLARDETAFEDGTLNFLAIPDVAEGVEWIGGLGMDRVHAHVTALTGRLLDGLAALRHASGRPMIRIYGPSTVRRRGGTVAFNVLSADGRVVDERVVARDTAARGISVRTGCFCNPGAGEAALGIERPRLLAAARAGTDQDTLDDYLVRLGLPTAGAIRASLGVASNADDVDRLLAFLADTYRDRSPGTTGLDPRERC
ncbi:aminotransferase class V-fold PLP-dependent enzyme [Actinomadura oligospora]|uniref:aminotransferase class V-fold PLP-dependent enzyme n=1 Tax=Actinomadura oligospora TaxID=111804 RepID=UPI0004BAFFFD|nr:aminotransferase class V-fold PLP-dependent enzyme [Actinomadura oligospora]